MIFFIPKKFYNNLFLMLAAEGKENHVKVIITYFGEHLDIKMMNKILEKSKYFEWWESDVARVAIGKAMKALMEN